MDTSFIWLRNGEITRIIGKHETIFIDEAQRIKDIGLISKIVHDRLKKKRLVISGSSSLELSNAMNEPQMPQE